LALWFQGTVIASPFASGLQQQEEQRRVCAFTGWWRESMTLDQLAYFALGCFVGAFALAAVLLFAARVSRRRRNAVARRRGGKSWRKSYS
jgi:hypothetical protein